MGFLFCLVSVLGSFGGILLAISLKGKLVMELGLEKANQKMFAIGAGSVGAALVISILYGILS